jgi:hypothetical protein
MIIYFYASPYPYPLNQKYNIIIDIDSVFMYHVDLLFDHHLLSKMIPILHYALLHLFYDILKKKKT